MNKPTTCPACDDGQGRSIYPYYGVAPHRCGYSMGKPVIGHSEELPQAEWPANFEPDGAANPGGPPGAGVYTHCLQCAKDAQP